MDVKRTISELRSERRQIEQVILSLERFIRFSSGTTEAAAQSVTESEWLENRTVVRNAAGLPCAEEKAVRMPPKRAFASVASWTGELDSEEKR
jgi:hypothetical protein